MFRIETNNNMMLSSGDNTGKVPVVICDNNSINSQEVIFSKDTFEVIDPSNLNISINKSDWRNKITQTSLYTFTYLNNWWILDNEVVNLIDYGITVLGTPTNNDYFQINFTSGNYGELIFYLMYPNSSCNRAIFAKKFDSNYNLDNQTGRIFININSSDSLLNDQGTFKDIPAGIYYYQLKAKLLNDNKQYEYITLMNKHCFYIIEDDYSDRVWTNKGIVEIFTAQTNNIITTY